MRTTIVVVSALSVLSVTGAQARPEGGSDTGFDDRAINHTDYGDGPAVTIDLEDLGDDRGTSTYPLYKGTLDVQNYGNRGRDADDTPNEHVPKGRFDVYFVISDASDREFAEEFGAMHAPALDFGLKNLNDGVENYYDNPNLGSAFGYNESTGAFKFAYHPGHVATGNTSIVGGGASGPGGAWGTMEYSALKVIRWKGRKVVINAPFMQWGDPAKGHRLVLDSPENFDQHGDGCFEGIRAAMPLQSYQSGLQDPGNGGPGTGGGPIALADRPVPGGDVVGCQNDRGQLDRYKGGQLVGLDFQEMTATYKLQLGIFQHDTLPYYNVFDTSGQPDAEFMGVIHTPRNNQLGRATDSAAVGNIEQWANGLLWPDGGPDRFSPGLTDYPGGDLGQAYTPMWQITWLFWNCGGDGYEVPDGLSQPIDTSDGGPQGDTPEFMRYRFMLNQLGRNCEEDVRQLAADGGGSNQGIGTYGNIDRWVDEGRILRTNSPPGNIPGSTGGRGTPPVPVVPLGSPTSVTNCPVPVTVRLDGAITPGGVARDGASGLHADLTGADGATGAISQDVQTVDHGPTGTGSVWNELGEVNLQASVPADVTELDLRVQYRHDELGQARSPVVVETLPVEGGDISIDQPLSDVPIALFEGAEVSFTYTVGDDIHVVAAGTLQ